MAIEKIDVVLTSDDFNSKGRIKAENLFRYLQKSAQNQTEAYHVSIEELIEKGQMWAITKMKVIMQGIIEPGKKYTFGTFPQSYKRATFKREFFVCEADKYDGINSPMLAIGTSQWCIMDFKTRKLVRDSGVGEILEDACEKDPLISGPIEKIKAKSPEFVGIHRVIKEDLDKNQHTNNCRYLTMAEEYVDRKGSYVIVNYVTETRLGDEIKLYREEQDKGVFVEGRKSSSEGGEEKVFEVYFGD